MAHDIELHVSAPEMLLPFLIASIPAKGRNKIKGILMRGQVTVDEKVVTRHDHPLSSGQQVKVHTVPQGPSAHVELFHGVRILFEDDDVLVIDKPPGLLSIASETELERTAYHVMTDYVQRKNPQDRIFIVHRLDRETSGVMMFAKNETVKKLLQDSWKEVVYERSYVAVVAGQVTPPAGTISTWLKETKTHLIYVSANSEEAQWAETHYETLRTSKDYTLLEVRLDTGRKNQIRVHMQHIGHSIVGDKRYGGHVDPIGRLGLHARVLSFRHPVTQRELRFATDVPKAFMRLFD